VFYLDIFFFYHPSSVLFPPVKLCFLFLFLILIDVIGDV